MPATYVVTGGTGFLGTHVVQQLLQQQATVKVLCRELPNIPCPGVEYTRCDLTDAAAVANCARGADGIFHLAGAVQHSRRAARHMQAANVDITRAVIKGAVSAQVPRMVYASTSGVVAVTDQQPLTTRGLGEAAPYATRVTARWPYYSAKIQAEQEALHMAATSGLELVCMRPSLLLGPGDARLSSCGTVLSLMQQTVPVVPCGGVAVVDVRDTAAAFVAAMRCAGAGGHTYLLSACNMPCADYFAMVCKTAGVQTPGLRLPRWLTWLFAAALWRLTALLTGTWNPALDPVLVEMGNVWWYADSSMAMQDLGFAPRPVEMTVADTVDWLREHTSVQNTPVQNTPVTNTLVE